MPSFCCWDSQLLLVIGAPLFQFIPQCPHISGRNTEDMQPGLDWSHLERSGRLRTLSEKAKENCRQELEAHGDKNEGDATAIDWDLDTPSKEDKEGLVD